MNAHVVVCAAAYLAYAALLVLMPRRIKKQVAAAGERVLALRGRSSRSYIAPLVIAPLLIGFTLLLDMGLLMDAVFCLCALLATYIVLNDALLRRHGGVYRTALIADGRLYAYAQIEALPTLAWEESPRDTLEILCTDGSSATVPFADSGERAAAVQQILELAPRLKPE